MTPGGKTLGWLGIAMLLVAGIACSGAEVVRQQLEGALRAQGERTLEATAGKPAIPESEPTMAAVSEGQETAPALHVQERLALAYPPVDVTWGLSDSSRAADGDTSVWPEMRYLGEEGQIGGVTVTPQEIRLVRGRSIPMLYSPEHDEMVDAPTGSPPAVGGLRDRPGLVIPPNASLVMVRMDADPALGYWAGRGQFVCSDKDASRFHYNNSFYRISYPGLGGRPFIPQSDRYWFGEYQGITGSACPESGWMYFFISGLDVDPSLLWLEYVAGTEPGELAFWTLSGRP